MADQSPFKSKFLIGSAGPLTVIGVRAWHDNQKEIQARDWEQWAAVTNECLKVLRQALQTR